MHNIIENDFNKLNSFMQPAKHPSQRLTSVFQTTMDASRSVTTLWEAITALATSATSCIPMAEIARVGGECGLIESLLEFENHIKNFDFYLRC